MKKLVFLLPALFIALAACDTDQVFDEEEQLQVDIDLIEAFLAENNLDADTLQPSQMRLIIHQQGSGSNAEFGSSVVIHYTGFLLDGTEFDSSIGSSPFDVVIGRGNVIRGWDIGLRELNAGTRATFYIPSGLAYGNNRQGIIPPNSVLIFDIEILDIR